MPLKTESRNWFERGIFDLAIAQAHLQSGIWGEGAKLARQAALKFLQAAIVAKGEPNPSPRVKDLLAAIAASGLALQANDDWTGLDQAAGDSDIPEPDARRYYDFAEQIRDSVRKLLEA
jgi:HEPN domain-containing protein